MKNLIFIPCIALLLTLNACGQLASNRLSAHRGVMNLEGWDFNKDGPIELNGEWELYWGRLLSPGDFTKGPQAPPQEYIEMPRFWNGVTVSGRELQGKGFATLRLTVRNKDDRTLLALKIPQMFSAYRLWVNGMQVSSNGTVGNDAASEIPQFLPKLAMIHPEGSTLTLLLQISNFHHPKGGMWSPITLGTERQIWSNQIILFAIEFFLLGGLIIMGCYHIIIFFFRKKDRTPLYFGLLCMVIAFRIPFEGERTLIEAFPWISWEINQKISFLAVYISIFIFNLYLYNLFPAIYSRRLLRLSVIIGAVFCVLVLALPVNIYFYSRYPNYVNLMFWNLYNCYVLIRAIRLRKKGAIFIIAGFTILIMTIIIDILYYERIISFGNIAAFGVLFFVSSQATVISSRISSAFLKVENLSGEKSRLFASSINIISSLLFASSSRLYEFTRDVARISVKVARAIGIPGENVEDIRIAALLHDIGMIGAADAVLAGKRMGSEADRAIIEHHPRKSIEIIEILKELGNVKNIIAQHHERYDGSGYPLHLKGDEIIMGARIIGLADDFVTMLGSRDYQLNDKKSKIIEELRRRSGVLYDPALVDILILLSDRENFIYEIDENDIRFEKDGDAAVWTLPSNVNFEISVVEKVIAEIRSRVTIDDTTAQLIDGGLGEVIRNAIIHGNKNDESRRVTVRFSTREDEGRLTLEFRVTDQGEGMDFIEYRHFNDSRFKLYEITRELKNFVMTLENEGSKELINGLSRRLQGFLMDYYINFNKFRQMESTDMTGGVGLIQVMQSFDNVEFRNIMENNAVSGLEVTLFKYIL